MFDRKEYYQRTKQKQLERVKRWRKENPERHRAAEQQRHVKRKERNPLSILIAGARSRAKRKGVPFTITPEALTQPTHCPVLGIELDYTNAGLHVDASASLDRIKPELGYVKGNVIVISWRANRIKCDATPEELQRVADFYRHLDTPA
jgi:DNA repair exonuclease SbcCD ATPase subunit